MAKKSIKPPTKSKKSVKKKGTSSNKWLKGFKFILNGFIWSGVMLGLVILFFSYDLPDIKRLQQGTRQPGISIVAQDGTMIATHGEIYGAQVSVETLPPHVWQAILAVEDRRFFDHFGVDVFGVARAIFANYQADRVVQGGSTITQQLSKNFFLSEKMYQPNDRSLRRKVQEVLFALWLEHKFTKKQILSIYLNRVYLGSGVYGVEAAAQKYFGKRAKNLNIYEAAVIAGLLKAPSRYSPSSSPDKAHERAQTVMKTMVEAGYISEQQRSSYKTVSEVINATHQNAQSARYFVDWIVESIPNYIGDINQDLLVITTLDTKLQRQAEKHAYAVMHTHGKSRHVSEVAVVSMFPDGAIQAMIGGNQYGISQFNHATQAQRQGGSALKTLVYLAALEKGWDPNAVISDEKICFRGWCPKNTGWQSRGEVRLTDALAYSINTATVRLAQKVGIAHIHNVAHRLGLTNPMAKDLSIALGTSDVSLLSLTSAYASFANGGLGVIPYGILEIRDRKGNVLYKRKSQGIGRVISYEHAKQMTQMLSAAIDYGTGRSAKLAGHAAGKSGTSQNHKDAWFIGYAANPHLVTGVWMGNDDNSSMNKVFGGNLPAQLWKQVMESAKTS